MKRAPSGQPGEFRDKIVKLHRVSASGWTEKPARWYASNRRAYSPQAFGILQGP
jgi:hypothetical protein